MSTDKFKDSFISALSGEGRVFIVPGRARPDHSPKYLYYAKAMGLNKSFGGLTPVYLPDPKTPRKFNINRQVRGAEENVTTQIMSRYARNIKSEILRLAQIGCPVDVHINFGDCPDISNAKEYSKSMILEDVSITAYSTEDLGALDPGENAKIDETFEIAASEFYETIFNTYKTVGGTSLTNEVVDVVRCDAISCGECADESDGCQVFFAITKAAGGSPGTPADILYTKDKFANISYNDIDSMSSSDDPTGVDCVDEYVVVVSNDTNSAHIALLSEFADGDDPTFTEVAAGFVVGGEPNAIYSVGNIAFIVGDGGYVYKMETPAAGVTVLDAGEATTAQLNDVHALSEQFAVAAGNSGVVLFTDDGEIWAEVPTRPVGIGVNINTIWAKTIDEWFVGCSDGTMYYTLDAGQSWTAIALPGTAPTSIQSIVMSSDSVMYVAAVVSGNARIYKSVFGGSSDTFRTEGNLPLGDQINQLEVCGIPDVDFVVGGGLADDAADGYLVVGDS